LLVASEIGWTAASSNTGANIAHNTSSDASAVLSASTNPPANEFLTLVGSDTSSPAITGQKSGLEITSPLTVRPNSNDPIEISGGSTTERFRSPGLIFGLDSLQIDRASAEQNDPSRSSNISAVANPQKPTSDEPAVLRIVPNSGAGEAIAIPTATAKDILPISSLPLRLAEPSMRSAITERSIARTWEIAAAACAVGILAAWLTTDERRGRSAEESLFNDHELIESGPLR